MGPANSNWITVELRLRVSRLILPTNYHHYHFIWLQKYPCWLNLYRTHGFFWSFFHYVRMRFFPGGGSKKRCYLKFWSVAKTSEYRDELFQIILRCINLGMLASMLDFYHTIFLSIVAFFDIHNESAPSFFICTPVRCTLISGILLELLLCGGQLVPISLRSWF